MDTENGIIYTPNTNQKTTMQEIEKVTNEPTPPIGGGNE